MEVERQYLGFADNVPIQILYSRDRLGVWEWRHRAHGPALLWS
jgi:hypothetical protein